MTTLRYTITPVRRCLAAASPKTNAQFLVTKHFFSSSAARNTHPRLRRSVHFVPGDNLKFLSKSLSLGADTLILDLEDSVKDKELGRRTVREFLDSLGGGAVSSARSEVLVRINPLSGSYWQDDVESAFHNADGFMVPKVESREELQMLDDFLQKLEQSEGVAPKVLLPIATETPSAVLNIAEIARGHRVCAITWGCEDLSAELGSFGTRNSSDKYLGIFSHCRNMCLLAAKAAGVQAIDGIYQNVREMKGFEQESRDAKYMGFDGKLTLHPNQIPLLHKVFEPTQEELNEADEIVSFWERGEGKGKGAVEMNGKMIDMPHYMRAKKVIARSNRRDASNDVTAAAKKEDETQEETRTTSTTTPDESNDIFPRVCMGKYFEELEPGLRIRHFLTRTVTESDNVFFTCLTMNPAPIHLDHELSKGNSAALSGGAKSESNAGKPLFNSMFTLALLVGMSVPEATREQLIDMPEFTCFSQLTNTIFSTCTDGTTVANLGFSEVLFPKPVYPGDTLRAETVILDRRESKSRPTQGIVTLQHLAYNQRGDIVCKATRQALMKKSAS
jgi:citrate lyase subunit beta/citryl-CoA lyase